jgi:hypothetical protein
MRKKRIPSGFIHKRDYPIGQFGGCSMGMYQSGPQAGGFAVIPAITAAYAGLKAVQPFSKAKRALEENTSEKSKKALGYKIAHKVASIGTSLGFGYTGQNTGIAGPITYSKGTHQPITGVGGSKSTRKIKYGTGKKHGTGKKPRKHKKK